MEEKIRKKLGFIALFVFSFFVFVVNVKAVTVITPNTTTIESTPIYLYEVNDLHEGKIAWNSNDAISGPYRVTWSMEPNPTFPERPNLDHSTLVVGNEESIGALILSTNNGNDGPYYVRVCEYIGGNECGRYSNEIAITVNPNIQKSITLTQSSMGNVHIAPSESSMMQNGFQITWSREPNPTYPARLNLDRTFYYSDDNLSLSQLEAFSGTGTYFLRVCENIPGTHQCELYSNEIPVQLDSSESIEITLNESIGNINITPNPSSMIQNGFRVTWSKEPNPTHPARTNLDQTFYYSDDNLSLSQLEAFDGTELYHIRVCENIPGTTQCGVYSNEISVRLESEEIEKSIEIEQSSTGNINITPTPSSMMQNGFYITWSKEPNPTHPVRANLDRSFAYSDDNLSLSQLTPFSGTGTYYLRVCEKMTNIPGTIECGVYSNEIAVRLTAEDDDDVRIWLFDQQNRKIKWEVSGHSKKGFKVVWSKNNNPTYPTRTGDKYRYHSSPYKDTDTLTAFNGNGVYYVRVCEYLGGKCGAYSNEIRIQLGDEDDNDDDSDVKIWLFDQQNGKIKWEVSGHSKKGFKVVWSKNNNPTYPTRTGDKYRYHSNPDTDTDTLTAFNGSGVYYVRVCEYLGGKCGAYSNEIRIQLGNGNDDNDQDPLKTINLRSNGAKVFWEADGYSKKGFKVVWSKNDNPTYPTRKGDRYHYLSSPRHNLDVLKPFDGTGTYYVRVCEYLGSRCGVYSNQISVNLSKENTDKVKDDIAIKDKAKDLYDNKIDQLLKEIKELRNTVKEQQVQLNHLRRLKKDLKQDISEAVENAINNFITYGVDDNTKRLGEGERAAVMYSYKKAFNKLPETEAELEDAIKIANGRWPGIMNEEAERRAKEQFEKIYKRIADMNNPKDAAAIKVMAYGLRQRAENRNLNSERQGIKTFKAIYGYHPSSTEDWNIMQAITYSGATRGTDTDGDLLTDERERELGTDPNNRDTDGDGFIDGIEVANGHDPLN